MSTIQKTDNYNLTMYNNVEYPLFLGDYSKSYCYKHTEQKLNIIGNNFAY